MRSVISCLFFFISSISFAQNKNEIIIGKKDSVYSKILKEKRAFWVHVPENNSPDGIFAPLRYPVIYLLDGYNADFSVVVSIVEKLSAGGGNLAFPKIIVIGIPNTDRTRDLTPTHIASAPSMDSNAARTSGGGEHFISFIEKELMPHIDSIYPTAPYKIFIGHSLGGLMSIYAMIHHPNIFNAYIAIDPSLFWDDKKILFQTKEALEKKSFAGKSLFLAIANSMNSGVDTNIIGPIMRATFQLDDYLKSNKQNGLNFSSKYYQEYDHQSIPTVSEYDGLKFLFNFYNFNFPFAEFFNPSYKADTILSEHYKKISKQMGYNVYPPEDFVNGIAYQLMSMNQLDRAYYFFSLNINNHPESFNAFDSMGDFFEKKGDRQKAIEYYSKSLALKETEDTRKKLDKLKVAK